MLAHTMTACDSSTSFNSVQKDPDAAPVSLAGNEVLAVLQVSAKGDGMSGTALMHVVGVNGPCGLSRLPSTAGATTCTTADRGERGDVDGTHRGSRKRSAPR